MKANLQYKKGLNVEEKVSNCIKICHATIKQSYRENILSVISIYEHINIIYCIS